MTASSPTEEAALERFAEFADVWGSMNFAKGQVWVMFAQSKD
ncbi:hypothetical protein [Streptomyces olivochromogenes]|nr:hypothetical protein [Streptomyces olivochromogenes]